jgi:hypothetical protein
VNDGVAGNDGFKLGGQFSLASGSFSVNPAANGPRVQIGAGARTPRVDVALPGRAYVAPGPGWLTLRGGTGYPFRDNRPGGTGGIKRMLVESKGGVAVQVAVSGKGGTFPVVPEDVPLGATVVLGGAAAAAAGECGELRFPAGACRVKARGTKLACK